MKKKKFDAILACRVGGSRLYGKPLQFLDIANRVTILEYLVKGIKAVRSIDSICLAIAQGKQNHGFAEMAERYDWDYIFGDENDILGRIIKAANKIDSDVLFLDSTESPFLYHDEADELYRYHVENNFSFSSISDLPEGAGFSIVNTETLQISHRNGTERHKELITTYVFENKTDFKINIKEPEEKLRRSEVRITVDYPEDLVFCRKVYKDLGGNNNLVKVTDIINYWDNNPEIRRPVEEIGVDWGHGRIWK